MFQRKFDQLATAFNIEFAFDIEAMCFHGAHTQIERIGDFLLEWSSAICAITERSRLLNASSCMRGYAMMGASAPFAVFILLCNITTPVVLVHTK